jgi:hypothetical protein
MAKRKTKTPPSARDDALAVFDGQEFCGSILEIGAAFVSYDAAGERIGVFKTLVEASRSIPTVHGAVDLQRDRSRPSPRV